MEYQGLLSPQQDMPTGGDDYDEGLLAQGGREAAAARMRQHVQPEGGRNEFTPEHLAAMAQAAMMLGVAPEVLMAKLAMSAPKVTAGAAGAAALMSGTATGADDEFKWNDTNTDRVKEMADIQKRMQERAGKITELGTTKTKSPAGTQSKTIDELRAMNTQELERLNALREQQTAERGEQLKLWQETNKAEKPFRHDQPTAYRNLPLAGWALSALGGLVASKGGSTAKSILGGAAGGTLASIPAATGPTVYDSATLPTGSKYQKEAAQWLRDPEYYKDKVIPEVVVGMLLGALGGKWGATLKGGSPQRNMPIPQSKPVTAPPTTGLLSPEGSAAIVPKSSPVTQNKTLKELMDLAEMEPLPVKKKGRK